MAALREIPSGKRTKSDGKIHHFSWENSSEMTNYQRDNECHEDIDMVRDDFNEMGCFGR